MHGHVLGEKDLEQRVVDFLATEGMCVLATCSENVPRASAVEFFEDGTTLYILTEGGRKVENISQNPAVSVAIHTQFIGWEKIKGIQTDRHRRDRQARFGDISRGRGGVSEKKRAGRP